MGVRLHNCKEITKAFGTLPLNLVECGFFLGALLHGLFRNVLTGVRPLVCVYAGAPHLRTAGRPGARLLHGPLYPHARALVGDTRAGAVMPLMPPIAVDAR